MTKSKIWLIWLAVMWENLARNIANNWYKISVYNRTEEKIKNFIDNLYSENILWTYNLEEFVKSLETPRKIIIMVKAWIAVDKVIENLIPLLDKNDIIIDSWNSFYKDTIRRYEFLKNYWLKFIWCWVSGWEEWALKWPSIMPGWDIEDYNAIKNILNDISAKDFKWWKCVSYIWNNWAWHFVKMVHNWIEYAIMQMIAEWYDILRKSSNLKAYEIWKIFDEYNKWKLNSYLFEITSKVLSKKDDLNENQYLIDYIRDTAWSKWTWLWTSIEWLEKWQAIWTIIEATEARSISSNKVLREKLSNIYNLEKNNLNINFDDLIKNLEDTLYIWMIISYAQWLMLINETSKQEKWNINIAEVTRIWQWWCIIRAKLLEFLTDIYSKNTSVENILELSEIKNEILSSIEQYKNTIKVWVDLWIPTPSLSSWLNYFFGITSEKTSANLIQWLRDFFWAHTYNRTDIEWIFHTKWE